MLTPEQSDYLQSLLYLALAIAVVSAIGVIIIDRVGGGRGR